MPHDPFIDPLPGDKLTRTSRQHDDVTWTVTGRTPEWVRFDISINGRSMANHCSLRRWQLIHKQNIFTVRG